MKYYIYRLPFILGCIAAIVAGIISYTNGTTNQVTYLRMAIVMLVFFLIGVYIKKTVLKLQTEIKEKEESERQKEREKRKEGENEKQVPSGNGKVSEEYVKTASANKDNKGYKIDLTADDPDKISEDDFEPLAASKAIRTKVKAE